MTDSRAATASIADRVRPIAAGAPVVGVHFLGSTPVFVLGEQADQLAPGPPWQAVRAFGNVLRRAYDQVDPARIWEIATRDLPSLAAVVEAALRRLDEATGIGSPANG